MKKVAIVGTDNGHAHMFGSIINGWRQDIPLPLKFSGRPPDPTVHLWGEFVHRLHMGEYGGPLPGIRVTSLWSDDANDARLLEQACGIERICSTPQEAIEDVDAVMVLSESPEAHFLHARHALERGLPTYIDKPMTRTSEEAQKLFSFASEHDAPCFTGSAMRYSPELLAVRDSQQHLLGETIGIYIHCPMSIPLYVSHALEITNLFVGIDVERVRAFEEENRQVALMQERSGISIVVDHVNIGTYPRYSGTLHGSKTFLPFCVSQIGFTALSFINEFSKFVESRISPVSPMESVATIRVGEAVLESLRTGKSVEIRNM